MASGSKLFTTVAALQCVERGQLNLDEDISNVLPEFTSPIILTGFDSVTGEPQLVKSTKTLTLRHLLSHSSGLSYDFASPAVKRWLESAARNTDDNVSAISM